MIILQRITSVKIVISSCLAGRKLVYKPKAGKFLELSEAWRIRHFSLFCTSCVVSVVTQRCSLLGNCDLIDSTKIN